MVNKRIRSGHYITGLGDGNVNGARGDRTISTTNDNKNKKEDFFRRIVRGGGNGGANAKSGSSTLLDEVIGGDRQHQQQQLQAKQQKQYQQTNMNIERLHQQLQQQRQQQHDAAAASANGHSNSDGDDWVMYFSPLMMGNGHHHHHPADPWQFSAFALLGAVVVISALFLHMISDAADLSQSHRHYHQFAQQQNNGKRHSPRTKIRKKKTDEWNEDEEEELLSESVRGKGKGKGTAAPGVITVSGMSMSGSAAHENKNLQPPQLYYPYQPRLSHHRHRKTMGTVATTAASSTTATNNAGAAVATKTTTAAGGSTAAAAVPLGNNAPQGDGGTGTTTTLGSSSAAGLQSRNYYLNPSGGATMSIYRCPKQGGGGGGGGVTPGSIRPVMTSGSVGQSPRTMSSVPSSSMPAVDTSPSRAVSPSKNYQHQGQTHYPLHRGITVGRSASATYHPNNAVAGEQPKGAVGLVAKPLCSGTSSFGSLVDISPQQSEQPTTLSSTRRHPGDSNEIPTLSTNATQVLSTARATGVMASPGEAHRRKRVSDHLNDQTPRVVNKQTVSFADSTKPESSTTRPGPPTASGTDLNFALPPQQQPPKKLPHRNMPSQEVHGQTLSLSQHESVDAHVIERSPRASKQSLPLVPMLDIPMGPIEKPPKSLDLLQVYQLMETGSISHWESFVAAESRILAKKAFTEERDGRSERPNSAASRSSRSSQSRVEYASSETSQGEGRYEVAEAEESRGQRAEDGESDGEYESNDPRKNIHHKRENWSTSTDSASSLQNDIDFSELKLVEVIGGGGFGQVWKAIWRGTPVAVKVLTGSAQSKNVPKAVLKEFAAEISLLKGMRHPNICLYMGACLVPPNRAIITELAANGSLWDALRLPLTPPYQASDGVSRDSWPLSIYQPQGRHGAPPTTVSRPPPAVPPRGTWPWILVKRVARGAAQGMAYLHSGKPPVLHRDLKSANILLDDSYTAKVCDFGLSRLKEKQDRSMTGNCGTVQWMAPEVLASTSYNEKADVFSYGIICWELLTRECPYDGMSAIQCALAVLNRNQRPEIPKWCPPSLFALVRACLKKNPNERPSFEQILLALDAMP